jgi:energy-coupling factor transporter ATP-binding protein EcfA2
MPALRMRDVRFRHDGSSSWALDGVSVDVEEGEFVAVLGPNGAGKSTFCLLCNGLAPHAVGGVVEGSVEVFGLDVSKRSVPEISASVGMVFQEPESQLFCMSVEEEVAFGPENLGVPRAEIADRVEWALEQVGLKGFNERPPASLSGGQKQRAAIAAAISMRPRMLVLDEPAYALDPVGRVELYSLLRRLVEKHGVTVIVAEREAEDVAPVCDRMILLRKGRIVKDGPPRELLREPDLLVGAGVSPPQLSELAARLRERVRGADLSFFTLEEAEREISEKVLSRPGGR